MPGLHLAASRDLVERLIHGGELPAIDISPHTEKRRHRPAWRVDPVDLEEFLKTRKNRKSPSAKCRAVSRRPQNTDVIPFV